ncbi:MAG TPA: hypothetical protein VFV88_03835 [Steroidobacteraceae bacterium]|nr:hypothetical protein [Steroidobacteraceae bacterium]
MNTRRATGLSLLPTAILFGMGVGNLWGVAGLFTRLSRPEWALLIPAVLLAVLVAFLTGVARAWWPRGAAIPLFLCIVAAWVVSAPWAAVHRKFSLWGWSLWLIVLFGCAALALFLAWLLERRKPTPADPSESTLAG